MKNRSLPADRKTALITILLKRFDKNMKRHEGISWNAVLERLEARPELLWSLNEMEESDGEPDVVGQDEQTGAYVFMDCAAESPKGRRSVCYDREGLESRKDHPPKTSATDMAAEMGIGLLDEAQYRKLQEWGPFDTKTSSWLRTPDAIREQGGAIFGDFRYGQTFVYHNGAQSYYAARGFRGVLSV